MNGRETYRGVSNIAVLLLSLIIFVVNEPLLSRIIKGTGIIALMSLFILLNYKKFLIINPSRNLSVLLGVLYIGFIVVYRIIGISDADLIHYYYIISFLFFAIFVSPITTALTSRQRDFLLGVIILSIFIAMVSNIILSKQFGAYYVRLEDYYSGLTNSVNTQYFSAVTIFCGTLLAQLRLSKAHKVLTLGMLVFNIYCIIFVGQRLIGILMLFAVILAEIAFTQNKSIGKFASLFGLLLAVIILIYNYEPILKWVSDIIGNERVSYRINQLLFALKYNSIEGSGGSLEARYDLISTSINTFISSVPAFLFGVGAHVSNTIIGNHSQWIDQAASYGIFGTVFLYYTLHRCFIDLACNIGLNKDDVFYPYYVVLLVFFVVRGLIGNVLYPYLGIMLFVFLPIVYLKIRDENSKIVTLV